MDYYGEMPYYREEFENALSWKYYHRWLFISQSKYKTHRLPIKVYNLASEEKPTMFLLSNYWRLETGPIHIEAAVNYTWQQKTQKANSRETTRWLSGQCLRHSGSPATGMGWVVGRLDHSGSALFCWLQGLWRKKQAWESREESLCPSYLSAEFYKYQFTIS